MGIVFGFGCLLSFCLLMAKAFTRIVPFRRADQILMGGHKFFCAAFLAFCVLHLIFVLPVFKNRSIFVWGTGLLAIVVFAWIVLSCHAGKIDGADWVRLHRTFAGVLLLCIAGHVASYWMDYRSYQMEVQRIQLHEVDVSEAADGEYIGAYDVGYIRAEVRVIVLNGRIEDIFLLKHENERGQGAEAVIPEIIKDQRIPVDAVSGATNSSRVIQMAVQNALTGENVSQ